MLLLKIEMRKGNGKDRSTEVGCRLSYVNEVDDKLSLLEIYIKYDLNIG